MLAKLTKVVCLSILVGCGEPERSVPDGGASVYVLFDERHDLQGGELVRLHEFDIGVVESVDLSRSRVRATVSLSPEALANLTTATTFTVEGEGDERYLETHVLDSDAAPLDEGASVPGADSSFELMSMRARVAAGGFANDALSSEWWGKASELVDDLKNELDAIDWSEEEDELRKDWEETLEELDGAAEQGQEELAKRLDEVVKKLEEAGRSDEAQRLKERFEELVDELQQGS